MVRTTTKKRSYVNAMVRITRNDPKDSVPWELSRNKDVASSLATSLKKFRNGPINHGTESMGSSLINNAINQAFLASSEIFEDRR